MKTFACWATPKHSQTETQITCLHNAKTLKEAKAYFKENFRNVGKVYKY